MEASSTYTEAPQATDEDESADVAGSLPASPLEESHRNFENIFSCSAILDLSQRGLCHLGEFFKIPSLQQLHLQRNTLCRIPKDFFQMLPNLTWLDLRYNRIRALPSGIGFHKHLKTLLLERNPIKILPVQLGQVTTLKALNLRHCPLEFPPQLIVRKGLKAILTFLRICFMEQTCPEVMDLPEEPDVPAVKKMSLRDFSYPVLAVPQDGTSSTGARTCPNTKEKSTLFPPVEKQDLSELQKSRDSSEYWPDQEEIKRFWKLRQEIVENQKEEVPENKLLAVELPPNLRAALSTKEKECLMPEPELRDKASSCKGVLPELSTTSQNGLQTTKLEESRGAALRERQEKPPLLERRRRRDKRVLQERREQTPMRKKALSKFQPWHQEVAHGYMGMQVTSKIPFTTDLTDHGKIPAHPHGKVKRRGERLKKRSAGMRALCASPLLGLEEKIRYHMKQSHVHRSFLGIDPLRGMKMTKQDLDIAHHLPLCSQQQLDPQKRHIMLSLSQTKKLQDEVRKLKLDLALKKDCSFATLTRSLSLHPPASKPQNIFFHKKILGNRYWQQ